MIKKTASFAVIALCAIVLGGFCCKSGEVDLGACRPLITDEDNGKQIQAKRGDTLCVKLLAQLGTGFGWYVEKAPPLLKSAGAPDQISVKQGEAGGSEYQVFRFTAQDAGTGEIEIFYKRPWVKDKPQEKTFKVTVSIQ